MVLVKLEFNFFNYKIFTTVYKYHWKDAREVIKNFKDPN